MKLLRCSIVIAILFISGCQHQVLYSDLTEYEANEMIALLYAGGISANKNAVKGQGKKGSSYDVTIEKKLLPQATALLRANGLPRQRFASIPDMFPKTMLQSPVEQMARLKHGLAQEMAKTLSTIDGVTDARVHLTLPQKPFTSIGSVLREQAGSSAAVFIKHRSDTDLQSSITKIKALIVDGVENMSYDDVTVVFFAEQPVVIPDNMQQDTAQPRVIMAAMTSSPLSVIAALLFMALLVICRLLIRQFAPARFNKSRSGSQTKTVER